jgi:hypothetical protein
MGYATSTGISDAAPTYYISKTPDRANGVPRAIPVGILLLAPHPPARVRLYVAVIRRYDDHVIAIGRDEYLSACPYG